ncbi:MAG: hypothetical protein Fur0032_17820 [Terrimicrobiaceae bacterium]
MQTEVLTMTEQRARETRFDLADRLLEFSAGVIRATAGFQSTFAGQHVAAQLIRASTSPLANHAESQGARSERDFVNKLRICLQEMRESQRWLILACRVPLVADPDGLSPLIRESDELIRIFYTSIRTAESKISTRLKESPDDAVDELHVALGTDCRPENFEVQSLGFNVQCSP